MTLNEAEERVDRIWGRARIISLHLRPNGGVDVNLTPVGMASDVRGRSFSAHRLDANGHPDCHNDCMDLEDAHGAR